uniref:SCAP N-terminal domain-containing protein n=1 Tax=Parascaris univalens TaxID=6257 RepID=A0A915B039_PARUN
WNIYNLSSALDNDILRTIFSPSCTPSMCVREMLLGMPTRMTGIKRKYRTNRPRSIDYVITLFSQ